MNVPKPTPNVSEIRAVKETAKQNVREMNAFPKSLTALALVSVKNPQKRDFVLEGLSAIGMGAVALTAEEVPQFRHVASVAKLHPNDLFAFDCFVFDGEDDDIDVVKCMKAGVVPIMPEKNVFTGILKDFNPMKFEGNGFFFKNDSPFAMFASVVSYQENVKFPEDRRILMKHVLETF